MSEWSTTPPASSGANEQKLAFATSTGLRLGGFVYGTIVAIAALVASARTYPHDADHATMLVALASLLLWLAHVYAHGVGESVARGEHLRIGELREIARHELPIIQAAVPLVGALLLSVVGLMSEDASLWLAFALGITLLGVQGLRFAADGATGSLRDAGRHRRKLQLRRRSRLVEAASHSLKADAGPPACVERVCCARFDPMEWAVIWGGDPEDVCLSASGVAQLSDLDALWHEAVSDPRWREGMKVLLDYRDSDWTHLSVNEIEQRATRIKEMAAEIGPQHIAHVVRDSANYQSVRLVALRLDWQVPFRTRLFTSIEAAREWLRVPTASLPHVVPRPEQ